MKAINLGNGHQQLMKLAAPLATFKNTHKGAHILTLVALLFFKPMGKRGKNLYQHVIKY